MKASLSALILLSGLTAMAADPFPMDTATLRRLSRPFPHRAEFSNRVTFRLPEGLRYVGEDNLSTFSEKMKLALAGDEVGVVVPDDLSWYTTIFIIKDDPLTGQADLSALSREPIATWHEKFTSDHTPRRAGAGRIWKLGNWTEAPVWDADKKTLTFAVRMTSEDGDDSKDMINYKIFAYGPEKQIICLQTIAPKSEWIKPVERTKKLVNEITFPPVATEVNSNEEMLYYAKLAGGGLVGAIVVIVGARMLMGGKSRSGSVGTARRPGLPR